MKTIIILVSVFFVAVCHAKPSPKLINALCQVESNGKALTIGDNGQAFGILQIHPSVVKDVNRIAKRKYKHEDCFTPECAKVICTVYLDHYGKLYTKKTGKVPTDEVYARIWNGGPTGWNPVHKARYKNTSKYWAKVKQKLANS